MLNYVEYGKENKYDDDIFFQKYSQMSRSQQGLAGAGEWETLRKLLGLKKTDRYWLVHKNVFESKEIAGKIRINIASFEK